MVKTPPDRLAAALRANLKRRKAVPPSAGPGARSQTTPKDRAISVEKPAPKPPARD